jgi:hypothetical protein
MYRDEYRGHVERPQPQLASWSGRGWRKSIAVLKSRLVKLWVGLYAPPPRRPGPML